jgi:hypothetical protein
MKYLHLLTEWIESIFAKKSLDQLNVKKEVLQKVLTELQYSVFLWGESRWQTLLAASLEALEKSSQHNQRLQVALQQADDLIDEAHITKKVRMALLDQVRRHAVLEKYQIDHYETTRRECLSRQEALNELENKIDCLVDKGHQIMNKSLSFKVKPLFNLNNWTSVEILKPYPLKTLQTRFSDKHICDWVKGEGDSRVVYRNFSQELLEKSATEKIVEEIKKAKNTLQHRVEKLEAKIDHGRKEIIAHNQCAIEHSTQVMLAHANRTEKISILLATFIQILQPHTHCIYLLNLMTEAQKIQKSLDADASSLDLQKQVLDLHNHRQLYEKSITTIWSTLFKHKKLKYQQQLNEHLETTISELITPICGWSDRKSAITPEKVKRLQKVANSLKIQQSDMAKEKIKIIQIKNIF